MFTSASARFLFCPLVTAEIFDPTAVVRAAAGEFLLAVTLAGGAAAVAQRRLLRSGASLAKGNVSGAMTGIKRMLKPGRVGGLNCRHSFLQQPCVMSTHQQQQQRQQRSRWISYSLLIEFWLCMSPDPSINMHHVFEADFAWKSKLQRLNA